MQTGSNVVNIAQEIDDIIARAMAEYAAARGVQAPEQTVVAAADSTNDAATITDNDLLEMTGMVFSGGIADQIIASNAASVDIGSLHSSDAPWTADRVISNEVDTSEEIEVSEDSESGPIPTNSESILVEETTSRFSSAIWHDIIQTKSICLAGLGGIGSYVAFLLSRLQPHSLIIYDDDIVEAGNLSGQMYGHHDIGDKKVYAANAMMGEYSEYYNTRCYTTRFDESSRGENIMICGFDNMGARRTFFNSWMRRVTILPEEERHKCLFIDGRLAAESFQVLCIKGDDIYNISRYQNEFLFSDEEAEETVCSYKQTSFMANMIASVMVNLFVNFCTNECNPIVPRDLPFFTEYAAETMYFKVVA